MAVRIASYNVRNLLDVQTSTAAEGKTEPELRALAGTIDALQADLLLLQEVGSLEILRSVNQRLSNPFPFVDLLEGNSDRGIHLAFMSRWPFELRSHRELLLTDQSGEPMLEFESAAGAAADEAKPQGMQRDLLLAEVRLPDAGTLAVFNVHLKSKTNREWRRQGADVIRAAECRLIAGVIDDYLGRFPDRPLLLGGDFNDTRHSESLAALFELPLSDPLGELLLKAGRNPSTYWPKRRMRLDYLLTSPAAQALVIDGSASIHTGQRARRASDHFPVSLDLDY